MLTDPDLYTQIHLQIRVKDVSHEGKIFNQISFSANTASKLKTSILNINKTEYKKITFV